MHVQAVVTLLIGVVGIVWMILNWIMEGEHEVVVKPDYEKMAQTIRLLGEAYARVPDQAKLTAEAMVKLGEAFRKAYGNSAQPVIVLDWPEYQLPTHEFSIMHRFTENQ
jgi:hypothetical protein